MSPAVQGYHFTFLSFGAFQTFFELGFYLVILNTAAHEWAHLTLREGVIEGPVSTRKRLAALLRFSLRWYAWISCAFVTVVLVAGWLFFSAQPDIGVSWRAPWIAMALCAGIQMWANASLSFFEGCGQIQDVYRIRIIAASSGQLAGWLVLACGGELWTGPVLIGVTALSQLLQIARRFSPFFRSLWVLPTAGALSWRTEIWPLQWRLGLQGMAGFFFFSLFTPIAFHYYGALAAGQVGMSWTLANGFLSVFSGWLQARAPGLAQLIAQNKHDEIDNLFRRTLVFSALALLLALISVWIVLTAVHLTGIAIAEKFLPPGPLACFFGAALLLHISSGFSMYFRAHKQDPGTALNLLTGIMIGIVVWAAGAMSGPAAMAAGFLLVLVLFLLPCQTAIFLRYRQRWHFKTLQSTKYDHAT
jgi:hypothetical protein